MAARLNSFQSHEFAYLHKFFLRDWSAPSGCAHHGRGLCPPRRSRLIFQLPDPNGLGPKTQETQQIRNADEQYVDANVPSVFITSLTHEIPYLPEVLFKIAQLKTLFQLGLMPFPEVIERCFGLIQLPQ